MADFSDVVRLAQQHSGIAQLLPVVEKEILHHEIIRNLAEAGLLHQLTFIGGTCLRACYGSNRLSEDLDFTGGKRFRAEDLRQLGKVVIKGVRESYGLEVVVSEPELVEGNVSTWKIQVLTHQGSRHLPQQRIHIDICAVASHERRPTVLRNHYGIDLGTSGLILQAESRHEILSDKALALAMRPNRVKHRDLWDIAWLVQQGERCDADLVLAKCDERGIPKAEFRSRLGRRLQELSGLRGAFTAEMTRFLPQAVRRTSVDQPDFWTYLVGTIGDCCRPLLAELPPGSPAFGM
jgi:predicted nucleotidyltransferase component of viral defense system